MGSSADPQPAASHTLSPPDFCPCMTLSPKSRSPGPQEGDSVQLPSWYGHVDITSVLFLTTSLSLIGLSSGRWPSVRLLA